MTTKFASSLATSRSKLQQTSRSCLSVCSLSLSLFNLQPPQLLISFLGLLFLSRSVSPGIVEFRETCIYNGRSIRRKNSRKLIKYMSNLARTSSEQLWMEAARCNNNNCCFWLPDDSVVLSYIHSFELLFDTYNSLLAESSQIWIVNSWKDKSCIREQE